jgi:hypothetical protein
MELIPAVDITIPGWLAWVTEFVNMGQAWPGPPASETGCWHDANDLRGTAHAVNELIGEVKRYRRRATLPDAVLSAALVGDTAGSVDAQFSALVDGRRIQGSIATVVSDAVNSSRSRTWAGLSQSKRLRGRLLSSAATSSR